MRIGLIAAEVGNPTSGQSRFLINLTKGLRSAGVDVSVSADSITAEGRRELEGRGATVAVARSGPGPAWSRAARLTRLSRIGHRVANVALALPPPDWYVVLADDAIAAIDHLPSANSAYVCNGDLALLFLNSPFYSTHRVSKWVLSLGMADLVRRNAGRASRFAVRIGNSEYTRQFMSYLYGVPFTGVVYPPVDLDLFRPFPGGPSGRHVVSLARNSHEQGIETLEALARLIPLKVIGGAKVAGAESLGVVPDTRLATELAQARFLAFPIVSELFGYAVAESLACGTPVLAFDSAGPGEQLEDGANGWLVRDRTTFVAKAVDLYQRGYPPVFRERAHLSADRFSPAACSAALLRGLAGVDSSELGPSGRLEHRSV